MITPVLAEKALSCFATEQVRLKEMLLQPIEFFVDILHSQRYAFHVGFASIPLAGPEHKHSLKKEERHEKENILADAACGILSADAGWQHSAGRY
jgi:hypothetical protein